MMMKLLSCLLMAALLQSCALKSSRQGALDALNRSALYDPPTITLIKGREYQFNEGVITGAGQKFHSHYTYLRSVTESINQ